MKKSMKILCIVLCIMMALSPVMLAADKDEKKPDSQEIAGITVTPNTSDDTVKGWGNTVVGIIKIVGVFVAVGALMAIGIKYMMGSAEEKAEYKKVMIPYIIGAVLLLAASLFVNKIAEFAGGIF